MSFISYATRDKEVDWRISQKPPLPGPFRLTTPHSCSSFILVAIVWSDFPIRLAICVIVTHLSKTIGSMVFCFCMISVQFLKSPFLAILFSSAFCIISITYIDTFNGNNNYLGQRQHKTISFLTVLRLDAKGLKIKSHFGQQDKNVPNLYRPIMILSLKVGLGHYLKY